MTDRAVIVGASLAGLRSAEALRRTGYAGQIVVLGAEPHQPYNRPPLSKRLFERAQDPALLARHRCADDVTWRLGTRVRSCDLDAQTVTLEDGEVLSWRGLVIATGLRPRRLTIPGPADGPLRLRTVEDAIALRDRLAAAGSAARPVVIGAGFLGCELAAAAAAVGIRAHLVAPEPQPLFMSVGEAVGTEVRRRLEHVGIRFQLGAVPLRYEGTNRIRRVVLSNLTELAADVVVEAVGGVPNVEWLEGNGLDLRDGVLTDEFLRVQRRPNVMACGDVARVPLPGNGSAVERLEHWTAAVDTGRRAGANLAAELLGEAASVSPVDFVPSFWSHLGETRLQAFGRPAAGTDDVRLLEGDLRSDAAVGYYRDDQLVGVVLLGLPGRHGHYLARLARTDQCLVSR